MSFLVQHIRSSEYAKRPQPLDLALGQLAVNFNSGSAGLFFRTTTGELAKAGPTHVGTSAPPQVNYTTPSIGEMWLDNTNATEPSLKIYTETGWVTSGVLDDSITTDKIAAGAVTVDKFSLNGSITPTSNQLFNLGSPTNRLATVFSQNASVSGAVLPSVDLGANIGSPSLRFANIYTGDLHLKNDRGDWTVIEEEDFLSLRNNKTGKRFKIVMEAID